MAAFFVTGAGTDIGKTWLSAALLGAWRARGLDPSAIKPVATGYDPERPRDSDAAALLTALGREPSRQAVEAITPFRFKAPLSPDQAARREGARLDAAAIAAICHPMIAGARGPVLVEGAGGVMSPLNERETMLDLALALQLPVIFVCGSYLGAISHALTGLAVLKARGATVALVAINETPASSVDLQDTRATVADHCGPVPVLALRRAAGQAACEAALAILG
jgi:dethiobiotin synthetase